MKKSFLLAVLCCISFEAFAGCQVMERKEAGVFMRGYFRGYLQSEDAITCYQEGIMEFYIHESGQQTLSQDIKIPIRNLYLQASSADLERISELGILQSGLTLASNEPLIARRYARDVDFSCRESSLCQGKEDKIVYQDLGDACRVAHYFESDKSGADTLALIATAILGERMDLEKMITSQTYRKRNDNEYQLYDLVSMENDLQLTMVTVAGDKRKVSATTEIFITECRSVNQKDFEKLYNRKPNIGKQGKTLAPSSIPPLDESISKAVKEMTLIPMTE